MSEKPFDFTAFMQSMQNPSPDDVRKGLGDAIQDEMDVVMAEFAPRMWALMHSQMSKNAGDGVYLNAVFNAAIFSLFAWLAACTPRGSETGRDNDEVLKEKVLKNLEYALNHSRGEGAQMASIAMGPGKQKLMEDCLAGVTEALRANSSIIQGIHAYLQQQKD